MGYDGLRASENFPKDGNLTPNLTTGFDDWIHSMQKGKQMAEKELFHSTVFMVDFIARHKVIG